MHSPAWSGWESLLHGPVLSLDPLAGGRNSRVWRLTGADGQRFLAKEYFRSPHDPRDRLVTEWTALQFLQQHTTCCVPRPIACDRPNSRALYSFIEGQSPVPYAAQARYMQPLTDFYSQLYDIREAACAAQLPPASEACFSLQEIVAQVQNRMGRLFTMELNTGIHHECIKFLHEYVAPQLEQATQVAQQCCLRAGLRANAPLPLHLRMPSPSDMGFHNAIQQPDGTVFFVDFEYFGLDDPVKLLVDVCLHPAMTLTAEQKRTFAEQILHHIEPQDSAVQARLAAYAPLWRLKWCLIVLNEFLPRERARRHFAGAVEQTYEQVLSLQLVKAKKLLQEDSHDIFSH